MLLGFVLQQLGLDVRQLRAQRQSLQHGVSLLSGYVVPLWILRFVRGVALHQPTRLL
jgi:hypothetical protein